MNENQVQLARNCLLNSTITATLLTVMLINHPWLIGAIWLAWYPFAIVLYRIFSTKTKSQSALVLKKTGPVIGRLGDQEIYDHVIAEDPVNKQLVLCNFVSALKDMKPQVKKRFIMLADILYAEPEFEVILPVV